MSLFAAIAERRIQEAMQRGELDDLPLKGQPLPHEDLSAVPEELRMGYKILKNAGFLPEELQLQQELVSLNKLIQTCETPEEQQALKRRMTLRQLHFDLLMEKQGRNLGYQDYEEKLARRLRNPEKP